MLPLFLALLVTLSLLSLSRNRSGRFSSDFESHEQSCLTLPRKTSKGEEFASQEEEDNANVPLLTSSPANMKAVKAVIQNGTARIAPTNSADNAANSPQKAAILPYQSTGGNDVPQDRYNIVLIILILHGVGILMPWNMFINANSYFTDYKLTYKSENGTQNVPSVYKEYFLSYLGFAAQVPNVLFNLLNIFFQFGGGNFTFRITGAIVIEIIIIVLTIALAIINTAQWTSGFFYLTMFSVVILNIANGVYQNSLYGLASKLPMKYSNAVVLGSNISGTLTSIVNIITIWASPDLRIAAIYYFVSALFVLLVCFDTYLAFPINKFFRYHVLDERTETHSQDTENKDSIEEIVENSERKVNQRPPYLYVLRFCWKQCLNVFLVFFVTLSVFPVIQANIKPLNKEFFGDVSTTESYFSAVCCFLVFNGSAMLGNIIPNYMQLPGPDKLWIPVLLRFIFIPFFLFCNFSPENRAWAVYIQSDWLFIAGGTLLGLTSGYFSSLCMMYAPRSVPSEHAGTAGMMAAACLVMGIFFGINFSALMAWFVKQSFV